MYVGIEKRISLGTKTVISNNIIFNCSVRWQHCCKNKFLYKNFFYIVLFIDSLAI